MPANKKYFSSPFQRFAKILAGFLGGYLVTASLFLATSVWLDKAAVFVTMIFGGFIIWAGLMISAFLFRNGWIAFGLYLLLSLSFSSIYYLNA